MKHINNVREIVDRLIENNFGCEYHKDTNTIEFMSCTTYELSEYELIGYHYVGVYEQYEVSLEEIGYSIDELATFVIVEAKKKVANCIQEKIKKEVINFLDSNIKYLS